MAANGKQIQLDGNLFHTLTLGNATSSQLVYMTNHATCLFLSQKVPNELRRAIGLPSTKWQRPAKQFSTQTWTLKKTAARTMTAPTHQKHHNLPGNTQPASHQQQEQQTLPNRTRRPQGNNQYCTTMNEKSL